MAGVVVGALLGGVAQIIADWLRGRRERQHYIRDTRRAAYAELVAADTDAWNRIELAVRLKDVQATQPGDRELVRTMVLESRQASTRLNAAVANVGLVAPTDTWKAATALMRVVAPSAVNFDDREARAKHQAARQRFLDLAHRDLGIPGTDPTASPDDNRLDTPPTDPPQRNERPT